MSKVESTIRLSYNPIVRLLQIMKNLKQFEVWFVTGSQNLYGEETLKQVDKDSKQIAAFLNESESIPCKVMFKADSHDPYPRIIT